MVTFFFEELDIPKPKYNLAINNKFERIYDLYEQIFDYFLLTYYDLNSEIENKYSVYEFKNKLETFADKHFLSAINDFMIVPMFV